MQGPVAKISILQRLAVVVRFARTLLFHKLNHRKQLTNTLPIIALVRVGARISVVTGIAVVGHLLALLSRVADHIHALLPRFVTLAARAFVVRAGHAALLALAPLEARDHTVAPVVTLGTRITRGTYAAATPAAVRAALLARTVGHTDDLDLDVRNLDVRNLDHINSCVHSVDKVKLDRPIPCTRHLHDLGKFVGIVAVRYSPHLRQWIRGSGRHELELLQRSVLDAAGRKCYRHRQQRPDQT